MKRFSVHRIEPPSWSAKRAAKINGISQANHQDIQRHRDAILTLVQDEVEEYLNTLDLVFDEGEDGFPNRSLMTGQYYIAEEYYDRCAGELPGGIVIAISTRFLEKAWYQGQADFDYLGLEVWIHCDPATWRFSIYRNTDSSVI